MYVSFFCSDFKELEVVEKESILLSLGVWAPPVFSLSDEDSTRTEPSFRAHHIMMAAARHWHELAENIRCAWRKRAVRLNLMPVPG